MRNESSIGSGQFTHELQKALGLIADMLGHDVSFDVSFSRLARRLVAAEGAGPAPVLPHHPAQRLLLAYEEVHCQTYNQVGLLQKSDKSEGKTLLIKKTW